MQRAGVIAAVGTVALVAAAIATGSPPPDAPGCQILPPNNSFNISVTGAPAAKNSQAILKQIGLKESFHADFGAGEFDGGPIGIPYTTVPGNQPRVPVRFLFDEESDAGPYPLPANAPIEGGPGANGDRHVLVIDRDDCVLYELFNARPQDGGASWTANSGARFDLNSNQVRPNGFTSADAAGLPIFPGLVRFDEVAAGRIDHALRFTLERTRNKHIFPARHDAGQKAKNLPPMGLRMRLKPSFNADGLPPQSRVIAKAMQSHGLILADNGSNYFVSGAPNGGWDNDDLRALGRIRGKDLVVVDSKKLPRP